MGSAKLIFGRGYTAGENIIFTRITFVTTRNMMKKLVIGITLLVIISTLAHATREERKAARQQRHDQLNANHPAGPARNAIQSRINGTRNQIREHIDDWKNVVNNIFNGTYSDQVKEWFHSRNITRDNLRNLLKERKDNAKANVQRFREQVMSRNATRDSINGFWADTRNRLHNRLSETRKHVEQITDHVVQKFQNLTAERKAHLQDDFNDVHQVLVRFAAYVKSFENSLESSFKAHGVTRDVAKTRAAMKHINDQRNQIWAAIGLHARNEISKVVDRVRGRHRGH